MHLDQQPEQYKLHPDLGSLYTHYSLGISTYDLIASANILGIKEDSRTGVIQALWNYIKTQNLQDKVDRRVVRADARLHPVRLISL